MTILISIIAAVILLFLLYILLLVRPSCRKINDERLLTEYAHRGLHGNGIPENSLAAFKRAAELGFGIELDVQLSSDGEVVVFHDYTLERMTGDKRKLSELSLDELKKLHLDGTEEEIPTMKEVLDAVEGRVPLLIELKGEDLNTGLCPRLDSVMQLCSGAYCVESFNPILLSWYRKNRPDVIRGILTTNLCKTKKFTILNFVLDLMALNAAARPDFIAYDHHFPHRFPVRICTKLYKAQPFVWTVKKQEEFRTAYAKGAKTIFEGFIPEMKVK
jgi:glycerophosphoryl diester phosphodiesterase